jgi:hypothetical protein
LRGGPTTTAVPSKAKITEQRTAPGTVGGVIPTVKLAPVSPAASLEGGRRRGWKQTKE